MVRTHHGCWQRVCRIWAHYCVYSLCLYNILTIIFTKRQNHKLSRGYITPLILQIGDHHTKFCRPIYTRKTLASSKCYGCKICSSCSWRSEYYFPLVNWFHRNHEEGETLGVLHWGLHCRHTLIFKIISFSHNIWWGECHCSRIYCARPTWVMLQFCLENPAIKASA